jgi:4-amino-4-deoxy-L-arabinose transferase-like glycosyltransferase
MADAESPRSRRIALGLAAAVVTVHGGLLWLYYRPVTKVPWGDENTYLTSARALLGGDPGWRPDALWPSLYPRFVAGLLWLYDGPLLIQLVQTGLLMAAAVLLADLVRHIAGSRTAGLVAGGLVTLYPPLVGFSHFLWSEVLHLFLFVVLLWVLIRRNDRLAWCVLAGIIMGLALLTKSLLTPFAPVLMIGAFARQPVRASATRAAVFLLATVVTVAPTMVGQWQRTGRLMIADSSAFNLWVGLNDTARRNFEADFVSGAYREYTASGDSFDQRDLVLRSKIQIYLLDHSWTEIIRGQLGKQYFRLFDKDSYLTDQLPGGAAVERYGAGYRQAGAVPSGLVRTGSYVSYGLILLLAPLGWLIWRYRDRRWLTILLLFLVYNLAIFFWLHVKTRFRVQMLPVFFMGVGTTVAYLEARLAGLDPPGEMPRWRWVAAGVTAVVLLVFGFAGGWLS